jgi:hypothetical protein
MRCPAFGLRQSSGYSERCGFATVEWTRGDFGQGFALFVNCHHMTQLLADDGRHENGAVQRGHVGIAQAGQVSQCLVRSGFEQRGEFAFLRLPLFVQLVFAQDDALGLQRLPQRRVSQRVAH